VGRRRQLEIVGVGVTAAVSLTTLTPANATPARERVTLEVERVYDPECYCYRLEFSGVISPPAPREYVAVTQRKCGLSFATSIAGASTRADGSWVAKSAASPTVSATYRVRWESRLSRPVTVRPRIGIRLTKLSAERYRVTVSTADAQQKMAGRSIELQRLTAGSWVLVRRVRLTAQRRAFGVFSADFAVRTRGLRMRTAVPAKSAAPCFTPAVSQTFVS
jgi:hypothetical protein